MTRAAMLVASHYPIIAQNMAPYNNIENLNQCVKLDRSYTIEINVVIEGGVIEIHCVTKPKD